jgi:NAD(P)-dependent dehydrogenase (short-subunit alcohol dehydrogenase family)
MVSYADVLNNNESLKSAGSGLTAVFVGATQGIGLGVLKALTKHTDSPTIFIVGRSETTLANIISELKTLNPTATLLPIRADDLTLLANVNTACDLITKHASAPSKIDILHLSPGYLSFSARNPSSEGLDKITAIRYYARMRFVTNLLPLLRAAPSPRVVSVLAGGKEGQLWADDFLLERHYSVGIAADASASMMTLLMEALAAEPANAKIVFVHLFPGIVGDTNLFGTEHFGAVLKFVIGWVVMPLIRPFCYTSEEVGERVVFAATSGRFRKLAYGASSSSSSSTSAGEGSLVSVGSDGRVGSGVYLVQADSSTVPAPTVLKEMREQGVGAKLYAHTMDVFAATGASAGGK